VVVGAIMICSFGLASAIISEKDSSTSWPLKLVWFGAGLDLTSTGGMVSFGPPVGADWRAQERAESHTIRGSQ
jgi:hypothetical protein